MANARAYYFGSAALLGAAVVMISGLVGASPAAPVRIAGESTTLAGGRVSTWATVDENNALQEVGLTMPVGVIEHPPAEPGDGPSGAFATLKFPREVKLWGFFDHAEVHWNPNGHEPLCFKKAHFDFHFYAIPEEAVRGIDKFVPENPDPASLPEGYAYLAEAGFHPQMGNHLIRLEVLEQPFTAVMIAGYNQGRVHFIEPMVTQESLLARRDFALEVPPRPKTLAGKPYPTRVQATYDRANDAYHFVFSGFTTGDAPIETTASR
jgi:hypothetical protein